MTCYFSGSVKCRNDVSKTRATLIAYQAAKYLEFFKLKLRVLSLFSEGLHCSTICRRVFIDFDP